MVKKIVFIVLGLIVAIVVIAECFSNTSIQTRTDHLENKISQKIDQVFEE
jgi:hypothetical protein